MFCSALIRCNSNLRSNFLICSETGLQVEVSWLYLYLYSVFCNSLLVRIRFYCTVSVFKSSLKTNIYWISLMIRSLLLLGSLANSYKLYIEVSSAKNIRVITQSESLLCINNYQSYWIHYRCCHSRQRPLQKKSAALKVDAVPNKEVVRINTVLRQLCFPLEYSKSQSFYVWDKAFPYVFKYDENALGTDCHGCLLHGFKIPLC